MKLAHTVPQTKACSHRKRMEHASKKEVVKKSTVRIDTEPVEDWAKSCNIDYELIIKIDFT